MLAGAVLSLALLLGPGPSEPPGRQAISLQWEVPPECPEQAEVRQRLLTLLGEEQPKGSVEVRGRILAEPERGFRLELQVENETGVTTRTLHAEQCGSLADAAALVVAVAVDPGEILGAVQPEGVVVDGARARPTRRVSGPRSVTPRSTSRQRSAEGSRIPERAARDRPTPKGDRRGSRDGADAMALRTGRAVAPARPVRFGFRVGPVVAAPSPNWGLQGVFGIFGQYWRAEVGGAYWFPHELEIFPSEAQAQAGDAGPSDSDLRARFDLWWLAARGCGVPAVRAFEFPLCAGIEAGVLQGRGLGDVVDARRQREPWTAATVGAAVMWMPWRFLGLSLGIEGFAPMILTQFRVGDITVHRVPSIGGRAMFAVEVRLP